MGENTLKSSVVIMITINLVEKTQRMRKTAAVIYSGTVEILYSIYFKWIIILRKMFSNQEIELETT